MQFGGKKRTQYLHRAVSKRDLQNFCGTHIAKKYGFSHKVREWGCAGCRNKLLCNVSLLEYSTADIS